jgi:hypothetical protein
LAPVVVIDEQVHGQVTPQGAVGLINDIRAMEALQKTAVATPAEQPATEESHV